MTTRDNAPEFSIRRLTAEDAEAVAELSGQLGYPASADELRKRLEDLSLTEERVAFAAEREGKLAGWIDASIERHLQSDACVVIGGLVVRDELRGLGIGKRLCEEIEAWTRSRSIPCLRVRSQIAREAAHRFYLREGYRVVKTSLVLEKRLT
jgi:GNAT superfamily N-acetyltransferase